MKRMEYLVKITPITSHMLVVALALNPVAEFEAA